MYFGLTEDQRALQETARRYAREKLLPHYQTREAEGRFDRAMVAEMGALGLIAPDLPEQFGGLGVDGLTAGVLIEEIGYGDLSVSYVQLLTMLCAGVVARHAKPDVAAEVLPQYIDGSLMIALGLTEPRGGTDAANLILRARRDGDHFILNGEKASISSAAQADHCLVAARTGAVEDGARGVTAFLVDLHSPGVTRSAYNDLGTCAVGRGSIWFEDVRVPAHSMVGNEGGGFTQVMQGFDYSRALIGLMCIGSAQASLDETWPYTLERQAFGRPIAEFQGVTFPLAEFDTQLQAARLLCHKTLWLRDQGMEHTKEAAMCKWWAPKLATDTIQQCLLTHGHLGYSKDLPHQQRMRDVLGLQIGDGTAQVSKMIIARETVGRASVQYARK
ncbi:MAG: acyl-CoA dehydrogenase family protein [Alphaproteobacteria bacterium]|nr:acyl-CoA dehydrogenase family protein [Alphaproteobacteria bacterium]MCB9930003.1 acyl-CoA dehydrogenase family protein [Alphaproteobacteria bacterium]